MEFKSLIKEPFTVIGKEIYSWDGDGLIPKIWDVVLSKKNELDGIVLTDEEGKPTGRWGIMSSYKRDFSPWIKNGSEGLYLAGFECAADAKAPAGWTKWNVPGFEFLIGKIEGENYFYRAMDELNAKGIFTVAATENWFDPSTGNICFAFPIKRL